MYKKLPILKVCLAGLVALGLCQKSFAYTIHSGVEESPLIFPATMKTSRAVNIVVEPNDNGHAIIKLFTSHNATVTVSVTPSITSLNPPAGTTNPVSNPIARSIVLAHGGTQSGPGASLTFNVGGGTGMAQSEIDIGGSLRVTGDSTATLYSGNMTLNVSERVGGTTRNFPVPFSLNLAYLASEQLRNQRALVFPPVISSSTATNSVVDPMNIGAARFAAAGTPGRFATIAVTNSSVTLKRNGDDNNHTITVNSFTYGCDARSNGFIRFDSSGKVDDICVGARARFPANIPAGVYSGTNVLRMTY